MVCLSIPAACACGNDLGQEAASGPEWLEAGMPQVQLVQARNALGEQCRALLSKAIPSLSRP